MLLAGGRRTDFLVPMGTWVGDLENEILELYHLV